MLILSARIRLNLFRMQLIFIIQLFIVSVSLSCSLHFVSVETYEYGYFVGKKLVILLFECVVGKYFNIFYVFSSPPSVYVGT